VGRTSNFTGPGIPGTPRRFVKGLDWFAEDVYRALLLYRIFSRKVGKSDVAGKSHMFVPTIKSGDIELPIFDDGSRDASVSMAQQQPGLNNIYVKRDFDDAVVDNADIIMTGIEQNGSTSFDGAAATNLDSLAQNTRKSKALGQDVEAPNEAKIVAIIKATSRNVVTL
jgi:hypothetical protein